MPLPDRLRLPFAFDPDLLVRDLASAAASFGWIEHFVKQNYDGEWSVIPLRGKAGATHPVMMIYADPTAREFADTPVLQNCPYFREVLERFRCPLHAVRLMRLTPGSRIKEHADLELSAEEGSARIHIPVTTSPAVEFYLNRSRIVMEAGSAWYLRLSDPHTVYNRGTADRVHLVIDAVVNEWLRAVLDEAVAGAAVRPAAGLTRMPELLKIAEPPPAPVPSPGGPELMVMQAAQVTFDLLTIEMFAGKLGQVFTLEEEDVPAIEFTLTEVTPLRNFANLPREPFSLIFVTRGIDALPQRMYALRHADLGLRSIFLVPIGRKGDEVSYQAIFN